MELYFLKEDFSLADGPIDSFTSAVWYERYFELGTFSVHFPRDVVTRALDAAYVCTGEENGEIKCGRIEYLTAGEEGDCEIGGHLLEVLLCDKVMEGSGVYSGSITEAVISAVRNNLPDSEVTVGECAGINEVATVPYGWGNLSDWVYSVLKPYGASYTVKLDPATGKPVFRIVKGKNRTLDGAAADGTQPAVFSASFGNIASISLDMDKSEMKNVAYVKGKDDTVVTVDKSGGGHRREIYSTAADITPGGFNTAEEYLAALKKRGEEILARRPLGFSISAECDGGALPQYGVDYFIGDLCDVSDDGLGLSFEMRLTAVDTVWENGVLSTFPLFGEEIRYLDRIKNKK